MSKSPSLRRIQADIRELALDPSDRYYASPLEHDMFEWHFTIRGADDTDFHGGIYHGRILVRFTTSFLPLTSWRVVFLGRSWGSCRCVLHERRRRIVSLRLILCLRWRIRPDHHSSPHVHSTLSASPG